MRELLLIAPREVKLAQIEDRPLQKGEVRALAVYSAISHGTELLLYRGISPFHDSHFSTERRLFVKQQEQTSYPLRLGYEWLGVVEEVGTEVDSFTRGALVHLPLPHAECHIFEAAAMAKLGVTPLPEAMPQRNALFLNSAGIALQAVHDANIQLGDQVVVFGLGSLGLLALQMARLSGAGLLIAVDINEQRAGIAQRMGADMVLNPRTEDIGYALREIGSGADVAIEFSGSTTALHQAIRSVRMAGRVVAAGFYQGGAGDLRLGEEWLHNRISMVASQQGWGNAHRNTPCWDRARLRTTSINLLLNGTLEVSALISNRFKFADIADAYELIDSSAPLKVIIEY